ncbi:uncharacterized protein (TIGR02145 family) [Dysgonomonas sp. PFB1-18]|uniref:FISUMP domain-containing protein n=1 Tax=unclassified Dysgonomonas TaxID=2630389 RepID=UPI002477286A|nr:MULTISPECIES: FISUMP domain-containing protein [unclassified Dysgonomonas]MDH6307344.1 uncharacterized protein (TIGR02145 family) [Dysgonomonas sp. PF1-14]MDH6337262.1 uncharacterized protein (TIGR02145 family) [Dysgonomonas sp. PF1-16]MDH6379186.1 uncharacterized protein (TIGR02145 family) [Dysgonomonas sp. PFB1-18]MDH6396176.1 uncharacterized protein (TIGR02145 family) [Dysgonomonas sp. PF1-23]
MKVTVFNALLILFLFEPVILCDLHAQVTIGLGAAPSKTALLQLKDKDPDIYNETSTSGGLLLPRTQLVDEQTLEPFAKTTDPYYQDYKRESVGLLVYNVGVAPNMDPGLYFWNGERWINVMSKSGSNPIPPIRPDPEISDLNDVRALSLPNSYILPQAQTLEISVIKGYAVWAKEILTPLSTMEMPTVELIWQSKPNLIEEVSLVQGTSPHQSRITVKANDIDGNAIVGIRVAGQIKWSWHIWVTNYNPEEESGQRKNGSIIFMDRNLGALYLSRDNINVLNLGMLYQWGRKDPFPGSDDSDDNNIERPVYLIDNSQTVIKKEAVPANSADNRTLTFTNPSTFYYNKNKDWYSTTGAYNDYLWVTNEGGKKGIYDPCPQGWKVPNQNAWTGLPVSGEYTSVTNGLDWSTPGTQYTGGHYPYSGYRDSESGNIVMKSKNNLVGYVWCNYSNPYIATTAYRLFFYDHDISLPTTQTPAPKAQGNAVRCVKEDTP